MDKLTPDTTLALMQTAQADIGKAASKTKASSINIEKATEAAREFEAVFIAEMMKPMFEGIEVEAPFGGGKGEEVFRSMMLQEYGKETAKNGGFGLADQLTKAMIQMQAEANNGGRHATQPITK